MEKHLPRLVRLIGACAMLTLALGGVAHADAGARARPGRLRQVASRSWPGAPSF